MYLLSISKNLRRRVSRLCMLFIFHTSNISLEPSFPHVSNAFCCHISLVCTTDPVVSNHLLSWVSSPLKTYFSVRLRRLWSLYFIFHSHFCISFFVYVSCICGDHCESYHTDEVQSPPKIRLEFNSSLFVCLPKSANLDMGHEYFAFTFRESGPEMGTDVFF